MRPCLLVLLLALPFALPGLADPVSYTGTFSLTGLSNLTPIGVGVGTAQVNPSSPGPHLTELQVPGGLASVMTTSSVTGTTFPFTGLVATVRDGAGTVTETAGGVLRGAIPLTGVVRVCIFADCLIGLDVPLTQNGTRGVGLGGPPIVVQGGLTTITLEGAPWQTGPVTAMSTNGTMITTEHAQGTAAGFGGLTSSTAAGSGMVQLVTPIQVVAGGIKLGFFGNYDVQFAPEPGSGLLLLAGAAGMLLLGRARRSR